MSNSIKTISASLTNGQRLLLLHRFTPVFSRVFCVQTTWAYNVAPDFAYPRQELELTLTGYHLGDGHEALVGTLSDRLQGSRFGTRETRPDGKLVHITLSTADGVPPARAGNIDADAVKPISWIALAVRLHMRNASQIRPTLLQAA